MALNKLFKCKNNYPSFLTYAIGYVLSLHRQLIFENIYWNE